MTAHHHQSQLTYIAAVSLVSFVLVSLLRWLHPVLFTNAQALLLAAVAGIAVLILSSRS